MKKTAKGLNLFLAGDSTMADKAKEEYPEHGWGMVLPDFFLPEVSIFNRAVNGRSTKSFRDEGRWDWIEERLQPGDYVLIEFGHNDEKDQDPSRFTAPRGEYSGNLRDFINKSRAKGALPVLLTPVCRRKFDAAGHLEMTHGDYPAAMKELARAEGVPLIDMESRSAALLRSLGPAESIKLFMHIRPGEYPNQPPEGKEDNTHFNETGARRMAALVTEGLREAVPALADWLLSRD